MKLRDVLQRFAERQEVKLAKHNIDRGERGWREESPEWLLARLVQEAVELQDALAAYRAGKSGATIAKVQGEAVDVANFAMMLADVIEHEWLDWAVRVQSGERHERQPGLQRAVAEAPK